MRDDETRLIKISFSFVFDCLHNYDMLVLFIILALHVVAEGSHHQVQFM
jgi:hypothetical protein